MSRKPRPHRRSRDPSQSGHCVKCGTWRHWLHRDHIVPKFAGGADTPENKQLLCANCHEDKTREDFKHRATPAYRAKISVALKGRKYSPERIANATAGRRAAALRRKEQSNADHHP